MIVNFFVFFFFTIAAEKVSGRGIRSEKELFKGEAEVHESDHPFHPVGSINKSIESLRPNGNPIPAILDKVKSSDVGIDHQTVDQEKIGLESRKKTAEEWNYQSVNLTVEYVPNNESETWGGEKKRKGDAGKVNRESTCEATTEELVATARATVTKALKGLCNANDMEERFDNLENSLAKQLSTVRNMILNLEKRMEEHEDAIIYGQRQLSGAMSKICPGIGSGRDRSVGNTDSNEKTSSGRTSADVPEDDASGARDPEILKFNSSIHLETNLNGPPKKVFTYYWRINDMAYKLTGWNSRKSIRSQSFYIFPSGYRMYMRVFPRQNEDNFYVRVGLTKGEFDESLKWPFPLRHKIHILDQTREGRLFEDVASRIWDPNSLCSDFNWQKPIVGDNHECAEVAFPHDVLSQREYIRKDSLVIKLTVYLES